MSDESDPLPSPLPSPCVRNCCLDRDSVCMGCYRTMTEICAWHDAPDSEKLEILIRSRTRYAARNAP